MSFDLLSTLCLWLLAVIILNIVATLPTLIERLAEDRPFFTQPTYWPWKIGGWLTLALLLSLVTRV
jgi:hypothetical protein